jgi:hypothetical protein
MDSRDLALFITHAKIDDPVFSLLVQKLLQQLDLIEATREDLHQMHVVLCKVEKYHKVAEELYNRIIEAS